MQTIAAAKFKEQCLRILDELDAEGIIVTKRGKPVAKVTPIVERTNDGDLIGILKGKMGIKGDIMSTGVEWEPGDGFDAPSGSDAPHNRDDRDEAARP